MSAVSPTISPAVELQSSPVVPLRFYIGMATIYGLIIAAYLTARSPLQQTVFDPPWINPVGTLVTALLCGGLLVMTFGAEDLTIGRIIGLIATVFVLGVLVDVLEATVGYVGEGGKIQWLAPFVQNLQPGIRGAPSAAGVALMIGIAVGSVALEEISKLVPVLVLMNLGKFPSPRAALTCAGLAGLTFGLIESNLFGYVELSARGDVLTEYIGRYVTMSTTHALWDVTGVGIALALARGSRPTVGVCLTAYVATVFIHLCHNGLQTIVAPSVQVVTIMGLLLPIYIFGKSAWRKSPAKPTERNLWPAVCLMAIFISGASAAMMRFNWTPLRNASGVEESRAAINQLQWALEGRREADLKQLADEFAPRKPLWPDVHQRLRAAVDLMRREELGQSDITERYSPVSVESGTFSADEVRKSIAARQAEMMLDRCRYDLNGYARGSGIDPPFPTVRRWQIEVTSISARGDAKQCLLLMTGQYPTDPLIPADESEPFQPASTSAWRTEIYLQDELPTLIVARVDQDTCQILDAVPLSPEDWDGDAQLPSGEKLHVRLRVGGN